MILVIDNYDSFTWNLVQQLERLSGDCASVVRNDEFDPNAVLASGAAAIVISPGPGHPSKAGRITELIRADERTPLLGVCLGHQAIGEAFGARVVRGRRPVHGKVEGIRHSGTGLFRGCSSPLPVARYHSLVVDPSSVPEELAVDAETGEGEVMAVSHRRRPVFGVQFHPESFGTTDGDRIVRNFLEIAAGSEP